MGLGVFGGPLGATRQAWRVSNIANIKQLEAIGRSLAEQDIKRAGGDILGKEIQLSIEGTWRRPIADYAALYGDDIIGVEAKMTGKLLDPKWKYTDPQRIGYGLIDEGAAATMIGKRAVEGEIAGGSISGIQRLEYTPWSTVTSMNSILPSAGASMLINGASVDLNLGATNYYDSHNLNGISIDLNLDIFSR